MLINSTGLQELRTCNPFFVSLYKFKNNYIIMGDLQDGVSQAKSWYKSKTIFGIVLAFVPTIIKLINPDLVLDIEGIVEEGFNAAEIVANTGDQFWATALQVFGGLTAIWGRIKAKVVLK